MACQRPSRLDEESKFARDSPLEGWSEMDSNVRFRNRSVPISGQPVRLPSRLTASRQELEVRIHFPPAASLRTIGSAGEDDG